MAIKEGTPRYVCGWCGMAKDNRMQRGYRDVGYLLAPRIKNFRPRQWSERKWLARLDVLMSYTARSQHEKVMQWCSAHYPALVALIPKRQQRRFSAGLIEQLRPNTASTSEAGTT